MGNYKFRLSDMIPNAWFHKLKDMSRSPRKKPSSSSAKKKKPSDSLPHPSNFYFSNRSLHTSSEAHFQQSSPRNSFNIRRAKRKTVYKPSPKPFGSSSPSVSAGSVTDWSQNKNKITSLHNQDSSDSLFMALESCSESFVYSFYNEDDDDFIPPASFDNQLAMWSRCSNLEISSSTDDIIIDMKNNNASKRKPLEAMEGFGSESTKMMKAYPASNQTNELRKGHLSMKVRKEKEHVCRIQKKHQKPVSGGRKSSANSPGIKLRVNSPRIQVSGRRSLSRTKSQRVVDSFAVIKRSIDPKKDFRESMLEMIMQNNIRASKDLEDLLACYLSLNPKKYHDVIIKVFEQIWFDVTKLRLK